MKLATIFTTVTLLIVLSCLPNNLTTCCKSKKIQESLPTERKLYFKDPEWNKDSKKLNVLIISVPAAGHSSVPLALAEELVRRGHKVTFSTSSNKSQAAAEKLGATFKTIGDSDFADLLTSNNKGMKDKIKLIPKFFLDYLNWK